eukprot:m.240630 g.240630  ORF g.240630 m.240630 type:complete len:103 (+) comp15610_c0_seq1:70-378(+)
MNKVQCIDKKLFCKRKGIFTETTRTYTQAPTQAPTQTPRKHQVPLLAVLLWLRSLIHGHLLTYFFMDQQILCNTAIQTNRLSLCQIGVFVVLCNAFCLTGAH